MIIKKFSLLGYFAFFMLFINCDKEEAKQPLLCCGDNPFASQNVNHLGLTNWFIPDVFTPNEDGLNDQFIIPFLANYSDYTITIYDLDDAVVFHELNDNKVLPVWFNGKMQNTVTELPYGTYKYKVVIENEATFVQYGYVCLIRNKSEAADHDFSNCKTPQTFTGEDPVLAN